MLDIALSNDKIPPKATNVKIMDYHRLSLSAALLAFFFSALEVRADVDAPALLDLNLYDPALSLVAADPTNAAAGRVTGSVPEGWEDNSPWAQLNVNYAISEEDGQKYLAIRTSSIMNGNASLRHLLPDYPNGSLFRLKVKMRGVARVPVVFGIREVGTPYAYAWSQTETLTSQWKEAEYLFTLEGNKQPMGFWWDVKGAGEVDIASLHLERISKDDLMTDLQARYPDNGPKNILRTTRLPLGLQSGWSINPRRWANTIGEGYNPAKPPDNHDPVVVPDPGMIGVSGFPALHLADDDKVSLWGEPFSVPLPFQKYTASLYVKGTGHGRLCVVRDGKDIAHQDFQAGSEWTRVEIPFEPQLVSKFYALRIDFSGELWVDGWQVGPGETAGPYVTQLPAEISLACLAKETAPQRIQFSDEPAKVEYCVTTGPGEKPAGLALHARVVDLYGETRVLPSVPLKAQATNKGRIDFAVFPQHPLGAFRIETWIEDKDGKQASPYQEIVVHRLHRPRYWGKDAPDSPFGTHVDSDLLHVTMAKAMGMNWVRSHDVGLWWSGWYYLERQPGQWTFQDEAVNHYRQLHLKLLATLVTTPPWASYFEKKHAVYFDEFYQPKDPAQYANYVSVFATHYKGVIDAYDIWNEPWNAAWFARSYDETKTDRAGYQPGKDSPADYAKLLKVAHAALKKVDPKITVVGINTTGTSSYTKSYPDIDGQDWSLCLSALKADEDCDVLSYHDYDSTFQGFPGDGATKQFDVAMAPFLQRGVAKPVWMTEGSAVGGYSASGFYHYTLPYTDTEDVMDTGNRACRFALSLLRNHVRKFFFYTMVVDYFGDRTSTQYVQLLTEEGALHPSADAFSAFAWRIEDTTFEKCLPLGHDTYAYLFAGKGRAVAVLAPPAGGASIELPARSDWEVTDLFGNAVTDPKVSSNDLTTIETSKSVDELEQAVTKLKISGP